MTNYQAADLLAAIMRVDPPHALALLNDIVRQTGVNYNCPPVAVEVVKVAELPEGHSSRVTKAWPCGEFGAEYPAFLTRSGADRLVTVAVVRVKYRGVNGHGQAVYGVQSEPWRSGAESQNASLWHQYTLWSD